jgi:DNA-binding CsgD family transcriptional regulator
VPFVGRTSELSLLGRHADEASSGRARLVCVEGEPGIGKSTLLARFIATLPGTVLLMASGDEAERLLCYGLASQLVESAGAAGFDPAAQPALALSGATDPLAVGAGLVAMLGQLQADGATVLLCVDDLHWADSASARALLFAMRRMRADRVLWLVSARPAELGEGWSRFISGDQRVTRMRLRGMCAAELTALACGLGVGELSRRGAARLIEHTGGNPLHCRALLEESGTGVWASAGGSLPVPQALAGVVAARLSSLSEPAQALVTAAAVLGPSSTFVAAASVAGLAEPVPALEEAVAAGLVAEEHSDCGDRIVFPQPLVRHSVYASLGPARRRLLHGQAAGLGGARDVLRHRAAAVGGPDGRLAADLEVAGLEDARGGQLAQAAAWLIQAAACSVSPPDRDRRLLEALEALVQCGEVADAERLVARLAQVPPTARVSALLGAIDLQAGRPGRAETRLAQAWQMHDRAQTPLIGARAALHLVTCCGLSGRLEEAVEWGERAADAAVSDPALRHQALGVLAVALALDQRGAQALARIGFMPGAPADVPLTETDVLINRGMVRVIIGDLVAAVTDLSVAASRLGGGVAARYGCQCLSYLAYAEYCLGAWDNAVRHGERAVTLAEGTGRAWDYSFVHAAAALVPAARGEWASAEAHVAAAADAARDFGTGLAITAAAAARAALAAARGDDDEVLHAAAAARATGHTDIFGRMGGHGWRGLEVSALVGAGDADAAEKALQELEAATGAAGPPAAQVTVARLRGLLASGRDDHAGAAESFDAAWQLAIGLGLPLQLAQLELDDGRRLRRCGRRMQAVARLRAARERMAGLGARPYVLACDRELAACGVAPRSADIPEVLGLTPAELAVARLVAKGCSNREAAAELYVSVKTVEFHLGHIFTKLGIRSRRALADLLGAQELVSMPGSLGGLTRPLG